MNTILLAITRAWIGHGNNIAGRVADLVRVGKIKSDNISIVKGVKSACAAIGSQRYSKG